MDIIVGQASRLPLLNCACGLGPGRRLPYSGASPVSGAAYASISMRAGSSMTSLIRRRNSTASRPQALRARDGHPRLAEDAREFARGG